MDNLKKTVEIQHTTRKFLGDQSFSFNIKILLVFVKFDDGILAFGHLNKEVNRAFNIYRLEIIMELICG